MAQVGLAGGDDLADLRRRISLLEDQWTDVQSFKHTDVGGFGASPALAQIATYLSRGHQQRVANPGPLGLYAFGYTTALLQGYNVRWTEKGTDNWAYAYGLVFGGLIQLLSGMWDLWRNNVFGGTAFSCFGGFWLGYALFQILVSARILPEPTSYVHGTQMAFLIWGCLSFTFLIGALVINIALTVLFVALTATFVCLAIGVDSHPTLTKVGGYLGLFTAAMAWYTATAELLNSVYRRTLLPLGVISRETKEPSLTGIARPDTL